MTKKLNRSLLVLLAAGFLLLPLAACEKEQGPMEELGESLDDAVDEIKDSADDLGDDLEDAAEEAGDKIEDAVDGDGTQ